MGCTIKLYYLYFGETLCKRIFFRRMIMIEKILIKLKLTSYEKIYRKKGAKIGKNCSFYNVDFDFGHAYLIEIGNNCTLTNCTILSHDASTKKVIGKTKIGKVVIGNNCFIGYGSIILPNVKIGDNCIIGAGTVVTKSIPENSIVAGNPAKIIGTYEKFKIKNEKLMENGPVFEKYWKNKSLEDKKYERELLKHDNFGFDE